jgi:uncharacterized membrane protein YhiD involved in acid resistance
MDQLSSLLGSAHLVGTEQVVFALLLTFALAFVFATAYRWTFVGFSYSRAFVHTMVLGAMVVCLIIMAIGSNLARGLGILGTLAIIRFRTPVRDPRDMIFLFACFGVGIGCGAGAYNVAIVGTVIISAAALVLHWSPFASRREYEGLLRFVLPAQPAAETEDAIKAVLQQYCAAFHLLAMREAAQGDALEYSYQIHLIDPSYHADLVDKLRAIGEVAEPSLLMHRTTVEL